MRRFAGLTFAFALLVVAPVLGAAPQAPADRLLGTWVEIQQFGDPEPKAPEERPVVEFKKGTYVHTYPAVPGRPVEGKWSVASGKGDELVIKQTVKLDAKTEIQAGEKRVLFKDADTIEIRLVKGGAGGVYQRKK